MVLQTLGLLCADAQAARLQTLTDGLCETTAIDIYLISPHPSTVSTMSRLAVVLLSFFSFSSPAYSVGDARGPLAHFS